MSAGERCYCGDTACPVCGRLQGTYHERSLIRAERYCDECGDLLTIHDYELCASCYLKLHPHTRWGRLELWLDQHQKEVELWIMIAVFSSTVLLAIGVALWTS